MKAGFAEADITPPVGTHKIGMLRDIITDSVLDPLFARVAVFDDGATRIGIIQLDTLSVRWSQVRDIRTRLEARYGFPGSNVMVTATHNHAGPAISTVGEVRRDEAYIETLTRTCVDAFGVALEAKEAAAIGFGSVFEFHVAGNRRLVMRDGTVKTQARFSDPNALYVEGPIDPEVAVLAARATDGRLLGCLVNFACHPTHHGGGTAISAGFPGVLAGALKRRGCPVALYLNGACGNTLTFDPVAGLDVTMEEAGQRLAADAWKVMETARFRKGSTLKLKAAQTTVPLPYRVVTDAEVAGTVRGAQRFIDPALYDMAMPGLRQRIAERVTQPAEVQVFEIGNVFLAAIPAEYFVEYGLRIKQAVHPKRVMVVSCANGMVGYVPTREAFTRGGYETTFAPTSRLAPEAGDILADAAIALAGGRS